MFFAEKIYYNDKPLILTNDRYTYIKEHPIAEGYLMLAGAFGRNFRLAFEHLGKFTSLGALIEDISPAALRSKLHHLYTPVDAAGGVVFNEQGQVLMIYRRGKWDLPKGKKDDDEDLEACALREVAEETGLQQLKLQEKIGDTFHVYAQNGQNLLKRTTWYRMTSHSNQPLTPQREESILEVKWVAPGNLGPVILKTYEAVREVLRSAGLKW